MPARLFPLQYAWKLLLALVFGASLIPCQLVDFLRHCHCICRLPTLFWGQVLNFYGLILIKANMLMSDYGSDPIPLGAFLIILVCHFDMGWYITNSFSQMIYLTAYWLHMICSTKWYLQLLPCVMHHAIVWSGYGRLDYTSQRNSSSSYFHLNSEIHELLDPLPTAADDHSICGKIDVFYGTPKLTDTFAALASQTDISFAWNSSASSIEPSIYRSDVLTRKAWLENQRQEVLLCFKGDDRNLASEDLAATMCFCYFSALYKGQSG
ncbi:uncharacterized protein LOC126788995 [Argentina anserina]|uniref:uncharacterized protein LOC126788995 n=1 Tax=Argentina anserina TaxID=57926 RepID=UPI002176347C|nr:uncharacterized protein LOC126788995 [Potentilla anserina]